MKRLEGAFTLAEVLITLAIIGVIAAITMPTLSVNVQRQQVGPALAKAINTLENANKLALSQNDARRLNEIAIENDTYLNTLPNISWREQSVLKTKRFGREEDGALVEATRLCNTTVDGIQYCGNPNVRFRADGNQEILNIWVDINGDKAPNQAGVDIFRFWVINDGSVVAFGSRAYQELGGERTWQNGGCDGTEQRPQDVNTCAGSIVDNGFRVIY